MHFTLDQAPSLIPWLRAVFGKIHRVLEMARRDSELGGTPPLRAASLAPNSEDGSPSSPNPSDPVLGAWADEVEALSLEDKRALLEGMVKAILEKGIIIQDLHRGLIDFPAWKGGREVLLCYELKDGGRIQFWHDLDAGYAGRQALEDMDDSSFQQGA
ncbi:DUF2203 family protein [Candidatus Sumerlaeota bacterium]|nr:DUF2203 family protein [Candidatus Sumerlaeota bacterium]